MNRNGDLDVNERRAAERQAMGLRESTHSKRAYAPLTVPLSLPQLPMQCPACGVKGTAQWPLGVFGGRLNLTCPACHCIAAELVAVQDHGHEHMPGGSVRRIP